MSSPALKLMEAAIPRLTPTLVAPDAWGRLQERVSALPLQAELHCIECRLGPGEAPVDWLCCFTAERRDAAAEAAVQLEGKPAWASFLRFLKGWRDPGSVLHGVRKIWLEFDLPGPPEPSMYFSVNGLPLAPVLDEAFLRLAERPLAPEVHQRVRDCVEALPQGATLNHVGVMLGRDGWLRLALGMKPHQLLAYLRALRWPHPLSGLEQAFTRDLPDVDLLGVALDVAPRGGAPGGFGPRLGLELAFFRSAEVEPRWAALLEPLVASGLCTPEKARNLLSWTGRSSLDSFTQLVRTLYHVKVIWEDDRPTCAKGYPMLHSGFSLLGGTG